MNYRRMVIGMAVILSAVSFAGAREDSYDILARELSEINIATTTPKIAIIPFSYVDKRKSDAGVIIAERLTTRIVKLKNCKVIERQLLESVMQELHLESTGIVDAETTKKLGKILGVEAIITGTLMETGEEKVEVNARTINTETAELLNTCSVEVKKTWSDTALPPAVQGSAPSQEIAPVQQYESAPTYKSASPSQIKSHGFVDVFLGNASGSMDFSFNNPGHITGPVLNLNLNGNVYNKIEFKGAQTKQSIMPIGVRFVGFGKYFGGAMEISYFSQHLAEQTGVKAYYNGASKGNDFNFYVDDYLQVSVLTLLSGDLLLRFSQGVVQPYVGLGIGMTLNTISSPYIYGYTSGSYGQGFSEMSVGFLFRIPVGIRVVVSPTASLFAEYRPTTNMFSFTRGGVSGDTDSVTLSTNMILFGAGFRF